jgi:hypothetical protein
VRTWMMTILFLLGSAILTRWIPFSSFFRNLDTTVHETGHAIVTLLFSGAVMNIELYPDHSGVTHSLISRSWSTVPIALAGYMTASLFAWLLFKLYAQGKFKQALMAISFLMAMALILFVRNGFGMMWLIGFLALNFVFWFIGSRTLTKYYVLLLAFLTLEESVLGPISLVLYAVQNPSQAGDASVLANATPIPAVAWAAGFTLFSLWCAKRAVTAFAGRKRAARAVRAPEY